MPDPDSRSRLAAIGVALLVTTLWSSSWILIRFGLDDEALPPITFAGLRYTAAATVVLAWTQSRADHRHELRDLDRTKLRQIVVLGIVFFAVTQGAQFVAIDAQPAATSSLMLAPTPFLVALFSSRSIGESVAARQVVGAILVIIGAVAYFSGDLGATWLGMIASVIGLGANATGALLGRHLNRDATVSPVVVTTVSMAVGATILLISGLTLEDVPSLSGRSIGIIVWLATVNTALAFTLWNLAQRRLAAVETAAINNTMLVQIAVLAWIFLGEAPGVVGIVGIVVVSIGAFVAQLRRDRTSAARRRAANPV